jgi:stress-induced-phosphoprotein 1
MALEDANKTVELKKDWPKGYSRKGAALYGLGDFVEAAEAYQEGLKLDPQNTQMTKGLQDAEQAMSSASGLGNMFGPDMWQKMATNPKLSPFLSQPDIMAKLQELQKNPNAINAYMNDPRMMTIIMGLMGIDANVATSAQEAAAQMEKMDEPVQPKAEPLKSAPPKEKAPEKKPEPEMNLSDEEREKLKIRKQSDAEKDLGNASYKARKFEEAIAHYEKAWDLDKTNVAVLTNKSGDS